MKEPANGLSPLNDTKHAIKMDGERRATLIIGDNDYPFPVPLIRVKGMWSFDTDEGLREILYRRICRDKLDTIQTCLAYVDAQQEYAAQDCQSAFKFDPGSASKNCMPNDSSSRHPIRRHNGPALIKATPSLPMRTII